MINQSLISTYSILLDKVGLPTTLSSQILMVYTLLGIPKIRSLIIWTIDLQISHQGDPFCCNLWPNNFFWVVLKYFLHIIVFHHSFFLYANTYSSLSPNATFMRCGTLIPKPRLSFISLLHSSWPNGINCC